MYELVIEDLFKHERNPAAIALTKCGSCVDDRCPSIIQSIKAIRDVMGISLGDAKVVVESGGAWADRTNEFSKLHDVAEGIYRSSLTEREDGVRQVDIDLTKDEE